MVDGEKQERNRTIGSAVGVFFLTWFCIVAGINIVLAALYGTYGSHGGLLAIGISVVFAIIWKRSSVHAALLAAIALAIGAALVGVIGYAGQSGTPDSPFQTSSSESQIASASSSGNESVADQNERFVREFEEASGQDRDAYDLLYKHPQDLMQSDEAKDIVSLHRYRGVGTDADGALDRITFGYVDDGIWNASYTTKGPNVDHLSPESTSEIVSLVVTQMAQANPEVVEQASADCINNEINKRFFPIGGLSDDPNEAEGILFCETEFEIDGEPYYFFSVSHLDHGASEFFVLRFSTKPLLDDSSHGTRDYDGVMEAIQG